MDELQLLSELLPPAAPPSLEVVAATRARLAAEPSRARSLPRAVTGRGRPHGWVLAAGAAATAAVVAAVTLTAGGTSAPAAQLSVFQLPAGAAATGTGGPGRPILLTAARAVARGAPTTSGRYWVSPAVAGNFIPVGHGDDHYLILEKSTNDQYMATEFRAWSPQVVQQLGVQLASPADRAAWQRAGSPTTWHVDQEYGLDTPQGPSVENLFAVKAGRDPLPFDMGATSTNKPFVIGNSDLSARQLLALPAGPGPLRRLVLGGETGWPGGDSSYLFQAVPAVLDMPVTPAVRAALYRLLASLPGVRSAGQVRDVAGQLGQAVTLTGRYAPCGHYSLGRFVQTGTRWLQAITRQGKHIRVKEPIGHQVGGWMFSSCVVQQRLVINPANGLPMAQELRYVKLPAGHAWSAPGGLFSYEIFGTPHWTSVLPHRSPTGR
jgi:hypothetical protein